MNNFGFRSGGFGFNNNNNNFNRNFNQNLNNQIPKPSNLPSNNNIVGVNNKPNNIAETTVFNKKPDQMPKREVRTANGAKQIMNSKGQNMILNDMRGIKP